MVQRTACRMTLAIGALALVACATPASAQQRGAVVSGRVVEAKTAVPIDLAQVTVEGTRIFALADSTGRYRLVGVPPGPQVLLVQRLGYADSRVPITVPPLGTVIQDIEMAVSALELEGLIVTADPSGRARGELGTASVVDQAAVANQTAASLAGVLELIPGEPLKPPNLDDVQQIALRSVPTSTSAALTLGGPSAQDLASFGTLIILDGVPVSNNANLQTTGSRGVLRVASSAGGGIDLRQIPASTLERVEVIRGVPSARYGDLTQGAIVVDTRAGVVEPTASVRWDAQLLEGSLVAGRALGSPQLASASFDLTRNELARSYGLADSYRLAAQLAHRALIGRIPAGRAGDGRLVLDTRLHFFKVNADSPENPEVLPGSAYWNRESGLRLSERARLALAGEAVVDLTAALGYTRRRSFVQSPLVAPALPFTDRLSEGRGTGRFIGGQYLSALTLEGDEWLIYSRLEGQKPQRFLGFDHRLRVGAELRREWNAGPGYGFDMESPPQVTFNGVRGFDRPRRFDAIAPVAASAVYFDDRLIRTVLGGAGLELQAGLRLDLLHEGTHWFSGIRDAVLQPRLNAQLAPWPWLRLRGAWGRVAKQPPVAYLYPPPQYFDVVNVNWYATDPAERLAVLTTFIRDPTNPDLGFATGRKAELGLEFAPRRGATSVSLVAFSDRTTGGVGIGARPDFLLRERFQLSDSTPGTGQPPQIIEPAFAVDTIPILIDWPENNLTLESEGIELTAALPELRPIRTRLHVQAAWMRTKFFKEGLDFGPPFTSEFQLNENISRAPFWEDPLRTGERAIITYRLIHHNPALGLVVTATIEHIAKEIEQNVAGTDSLAFAGYITRSGRLVYVPVEERASPEYSDLRVPRTGTFVDLNETPPDWLMSLQVSKTLPRGGRLSFFAFNVLDRRGRREPGVGIRVFPELEFGVEAMLPLGGLF